MVDPTISERGRQGERGRTGAAGSPPLSRTKTLAMFVFVVLAFVLLAYRTEVNFNNNNNDTHRACIQSNRTIVAVNEILNQLIEFQGNAPPKLPPAEEKQRDQRYMALMMIPLECPSPS